MLRASAMAVVTLLGVATGRGPGGRRALCLAVLLLLLGNPALVGSLAFQLSVAATAGVLWLGPLAARLLPSRLPEMVRVGVGVSLGAQAVAMPVVALTLGRVSLAGLAANLVAAPHRKAPQSYISCYPMHRAPEQPKQGLQEGKRWSGGQGFTSGSPGLLMAAP